MYKYNIKSVLFLIMNMICLDCVGQNLIEKYSKNYYIDLIAYDPTFRYDDYGKMIETDKAVLHIADGALSESQISEAAKDINKIIEELENYLGKNVKDEWYGEIKVSYFIKKYIFPRCIGSYQKPVVYVWAEDGKIPLYAHETTHIVAGCSNSCSTWMVEGLVVFLNEKFSDYPTWPQYSYDLHKKAKLICSSIYEIPFEKENSYHEVPPNTPYGEKYYIIAGSFVRYIVESIGIEKYMEIYKSRDTNTSFYEFTNYSITEWKRKWIEFINII